MSEHVFGAEDDRVRAQQREAVTRREGQVRKSPWHSIKQSVHHNNTDCNTGNNIERENRRDGDGGKPLCSECSRL